MHSSQCAQCSVHQCLVHHRVCVKQVKTRLLEMIPGIKAFLDVDDLKEGKGAEYVDVSSVSLVFCSRGYFESANCMRELLRAVVTRKPILPLLEPEQNKGGLGRGTVSREEHPSERESSILLGVSVGVR